MWTGGQSKVLVVRTRVAKVEVEVTKEEEDEDGYMEGGGILPSVSSAEWSSKGLLGHCYRPLKGLYVDN